MAPNITWIGIVDNIHLLLWSIWFVFPNLLSSKRHLQVCILCHVIRAWDQFGCFSALKFTRPPESFVPNICWCKLVQRMRMNISFALSQITLSWIEISKKGKICEYFLEAVIVFIVLDLSAPRLKARPLRHPVGCGLRNGKWRKPEMSRILRQIVIRTTFGTRKTPASSVSWKWLQPAHVSVVQIDKIPN